MTPHDLYAEMAGAAGPARRAARTPADLLAGARPVVLYGAGNMGREVLRLLTSQGWGVRCFLDRNARPGDQVEGVPVHPLDAPACDEEARRETPVIVTIFNPDVAMPALLQQLRGLGWRNVMPFVEFHRFFAAELGDRFWLTELDFYRGLAGPMRAAADLWSDRRSREVYDAVLRYRLEADPACLPAPDLDNQYFPNDVPAWEWPCRFVDCGAFDGDTLAHLSDTGFALEAVAAFEPDADNLRQLSRQMASLAAAPAGPETLLWPCAVSSATARLRFDSGRGAASGLSTDGPEFVQAVALDEALIGFRPTLIKMDIEGAEHDALLGARGLIERHRPGLAICVYHRPQDLWEIPLLLQSWNLGYRFYLRSHRHNGFDLVLYAVPATPENPLP